MFNTKPVYYVKTLYKTSKGGFEIVRGCNLQSIPNSGIKSSIREFTPKSSQRLAFYASQAKDDWQSMITLTYGEKFPSDFKVYKKHLNAFLSLVRSRIYGVKYLWFMEFQKRGAVHFHILLNKKPVKSHWLKFAKSWSLVQFDTGNDYDKAYWFNSFERGEFWEVERVKNGLSHYAVKYALKREQKELPKNIVGAGRFWGTSRDIVSRETIFTSSGDRETSQVIELLKQKKPEVAQYIDKLRYLY